MHFFSWRFKGNILQHHSTISYRVRETQLYPIYIYKHGYFRSVRITSSCLKITRLPKNDHSAFHCIKCVTIVLSIASVILCAYSFNTLFLGPAKRGRQSSIYSLASLEGDRGVGGGGFMSHEFEPLYNFAENIFSLLLILMGVFSKYLILIHRL